METTDDQLVQQSMYMVFFIAKGKPTFFFPPGVLLDAVFAGNAKENPTHVVVFVLQRKPYPCLLHHICAEQEVWSTVAGGRTVSFWKQMPNAL
jgi:hypothetical protein